MAAGVQRGGEVVVGERARLARDELAQRLLRAERGAEEVAQLDEAPAGQQHAAARDGARDGRLVQPDLGRDRRARQRPQRGRAA